MWCKHCRQDVPGIRSPSQSGGKLCRGAAHNCRVMKSRASRMSCRLAPAAEHGLDLDASPAPVSDLSQLRRLASRPERAPIASPGRSLARRAAASSRARDQVPVASPTGKLTQRTPRRLRPHAGSRDRADAIGSLATDHACGWVWWPSRSAPGCWPGRSSKTAWSCGTWACRWSSAGRLRIAAGPGVAVGTRLAKQPRRGAKTAAGRLAACTDSSVRRL